MYRLHMELISRIHRLIIELIKNEQNIKEEDEGVTPSVITRLRKVYRSKYGKERRLGIGESNAIYLISCHFTSSGDTLKYQFAFNSNFD